MTKTASLWLVKSTTRKTAKSWTQTALRRHIRQDTETAPKCLLKIPPPRTICINSKDENGKQPSIADRVYDSNGIATALTTGWHPYIMESQNNNSENE